MQSQAIPKRVPLPNDVTRFALGLLVLTLTLLLFFTAAAPFLNRLVIEPTCDAAADNTFDSFAAETAVPDCWLVQ